MKSQTISYIGQRGQVVLPIELRRNLGITEDKPLNIYLEGKRIIIEILGEESHKNSLLYQAIDNARGSWAGDSFPDNREFELKETEKSKKAW